MIRAGSFNEPARLFDDPAYGGQSDQNSCDCYIFTPTLTLVVRPQNFAQLPCALGYGTKDPQKYGNEKERCREQRREEQHREVQEQQYKAQQ